MPLVWRCMLCRSFMPFEMAACQACCAHVLSQTYLGCCRCGRATCPGMCEKLSLFTSVHSLLALHSSLAFLLVEAKDRQNPLAQNLFDSLLGVAFERRFCKIVDENSINRVVVAPLRWGRLLSGGWHPVLFFEKRLKSHCQKKNIAFEMAAPVLRQRQAKVQAEAREKAVEKWEKNWSEGRDLKSVDNGGSQDRVLLIDDVLTSGKSTLDFLLGAQKKHVANNTKWHLLTLFRTPRPS